MENILTKSKGFVKAQVITVEIRIRYLFGTSGSASPSSPTVWVGGSVASRYSFNTVRVNFTETVRGNCSVSLLTVKKINRDELNKDHNLSR